MKDVTRATYDQIAPHFAEVNGQMPDNLINDLRTFVEHTSPNGLYLDLGCGAGRDIAWFETQNLKMIGADFSSGMLNQARKVVHGPLTQMDMRSLGFDDSSFDGIWCNAALLHLSKAEAAGCLRELRRVLRDKGILDLAIQQGEGEVLEINPYTQSGERFFARYTMDEMSSLLIAHQFSILDVHAFQAPNRHWLRFLTRVTK